MGEQNIALPTNKKTMWICSKCADKIKTKDPSAGMWKAGTCDYCHLPNYVTQPKDFGISEKRIGSDKTVVGLMDMFGMK